MHMTSKHTDLHTIAIHNNWRIWLMYNQTMYKV